MKRYGGVHFVCVSKMPPRLTTANCVTRPLVRNTELQARQDCAIEKWIRAYVGHSATRPPTAKPQQSASREPWENVKNVLSHVTARDARGREPGSRSRGLNRRARTGIQVTRAESEG